MQGTLLQAFSLRETSGWFSASDHNKTLGREEEANQTTFDWREEKTRVKWREEFVTVPAWQGVRITCCVTELLVGGLLTWKHLGPMVLVNFCA